MNAEGARYAFIERDYTPPYEVPELSAASPATTAELAVANLLSAMARADFDWAVATFGEDGEALLKLAGAKRADFEAGWRAQYAGRRWRLTRRIDLEDTVLIYKADAVTGEEDPLPYALRPSRTRGWELTQSLSGHPVYAYERHGVRPTLVHP